MTRHLLTAAVLSICATPAVAQFSPGSPQYGPMLPDPYAFGPTNPYNRTSQPLSPYLNLLRGGNPAVNYAYGVRPGTVNRGGSSGGAPFTAPGAQRAPYFPMQQAMPQDPLALPSPTAGYVLPPAGHPVLFNNTMGYYPSPLGARPQSAGSLSGAGTRSGVRR